jgi:Aerotolerance regulator N-terminal
MFESFVHPWMFVAGAALISAPIIIHLINRIRFKRIRWAAMEFLLKSQKRNRRRLILEQLLLLALRCFLVFLVGLLVSRFIGDLTNRFAAAPAVHAMVIDDTMSMGDPIPPNLVLTNNFDILAGSGTPVEPTCFGLAKANVKRIAHNVVKNDSAQWVRVYLLSDLQNPIFDARLNDTTLTTLETTLDNLNPNPTYMHIPTLDGVQAAREFLSGRAEKKKYLHLVSDFREIDWSNTDSDLAKAVENLTQAEVNVYMVDCAAPFRNEGQQVVQNHDNIALVDFQPESRIVSNEGQPIEFTLKIHNYSPAERKNLMLKVYDDDGERFEGSQPIPSIPVGDYDFRFQLGFIKEGFNHITAKLDDASGLEVDNVRHAVVEVRKRIPILVIDGGFPDVDGEFSDTRFLKTALTAAKGYDVTAAGVDGLEKVDLKTYPSIFILNVPKIQSEKGLKNLEEYVSQGGRIAFFLGDRVQAQEYNKTLYDGGKGLFPVPLAARPTDKPKKEEREDMMINGQMKLLSRKPDHQILRGLNLPEVKPWLRILMIDQYYPTLPRFQWADKAEDIEIATLPSRKELGDFVGRAQELYNKFPLEDPAARDKYAKYVPALERHRDNIRRALAGGRYLYELANALDAVLNDRGDPEKKDPKWPNLKDEFWELPEQRDLAEALRDLHATTQFGDPLVLSKRFGKGHVVAVLTSASTRWNEWSGGSVASFTFPMFVTDLEKYLTGGNEEANRPVGSTLTLTFDPTRYKDKVHRKFFKGGEPGGRPAPKDGKDEAPKNYIDKGEQTLIKEKNQLVFDFNEAKEPGMYEFTFYPIGNPDPPPEFRAYVFNVDTEHESDLRRAPIDKLERNPAGAPPTQGKMKMLFPDSNLRDILKQRKNDFSEAPWIYLVFLVVLILEQMLAVHLSFHLRGGTNEAALPAQVLRSQGVAG